MTRFIGCFVAAAIILALFFPYMAGKGSREVYNEFVAGWEAGQP